MKRCKRALSWFLICAMLLTLIPDRAYAMEVQEEAATMETVTEESEATVIETATEKKATTEMVTEQSAEEVTETATTEAATEVTTEEVTAQESVTAVEQAADVAEQATVAEEPVLPDQGVAKTAKRQMKVSAKAASTSGTVQADGSWGAGYTWYIMSGGKKHYIFCIDHGMEMHSGLYTPSSVVGTLFDSEKSTFRVAVAMDYFQLHGGFASPNGYEDAQRVVWNIGGTDTSDKLINYANNLYNLKYGGTSFSSALTKVDGKEWSDVKDANLTKKKVKYENGKVTNQTVTFSGTAWRYFAGGANGWGSTTIADVYDSDGNSIKNKVNISLSSSGNLKCSFDKSYAPKKSQALTVVMKVEGTYGGDTKIHYLDCGKSKQRLTFDANYNSNAYFAIQLYTDKVDSEGARVRIKKVDEFGNTIPGATFRLYSPNPMIGYDAYVSPDPDDLDSGYFPEITQAGYYYLEETVAPEGMIGLEHRIYIIEATKVTENNVEKINLSLQNAEMVQDLMQVETTSTSIDLQLTGVNQYRSGSASLTKMGEMLWSWDGSKFVTVQRRVKYVTFRLYAAEDIVLKNDEVLFPAGTEITQQVLDASKWNNGGAAATGRRAKATIETITDGDGNIYYRNLPAGNYYVKEQSTAQGYVQDLSRNDFTIVAGENDTKITNQAGAATGYFVNTPDNASVYVKKIEKSLEKNDQKKEETPIAGAQFTLYMKVSSKNPDGDYFFSAADTVPAVVSRDPNGTPTYEYNTWVPLKTASSDSNGYVDFGLKIPAYKNCSYMVTETKPADGYCYANSDEDGNLQGVSSYIWTYNGFGQKVLPDGTVEGSQADASNGKTFYITETNAEQHNFILIQKTGELLYDASTEKTDYGTYRKLNYKSLSAKDIEFEIRDKDGNVIEKLTTGEDGTAKSSNLVSGTYYVYETSTDPSLKLDTEPKEVVIEEDNTVAEQVETVEFTNESLPTKLHIYKQGEMVSLSADKVSGVSSSDAVYSYNKAALSGVVFGIYAKNDIKNYNGTVIVKAGSCVGYAVTDNQGVATMDAQLASGEYYYKEIKTAGKNYIRDTKEYPFTLTLNGQAVDMDINKDTPMVNEQYKGSIKVIKTDADTKKVLSGVEFSLYDQDENEIADFVTDDNGEIFIDKLPIGRYYLQETKTQKGYYLDDEMQEIDLTTSNLDQVLEIENEQREKSATSITVSTNTTVKGSGIVRTGDMITRIMMLLMCLAVAAWMMLYQMRPGRKFNVKKLRSMLLTAVIGASVLLPAGQVRAADMEGWSLTTGSVMIDGVESTDWSVHLVDVQYSEASNKRIITDKTSVSSVSGGNGDWVYLAVYHGDELMYLSQSKIYIQASGIPSGDQHEFVLVGNGTAAKTVEVKGKIEIVKPWMQENNVTHDYNISGLVTSADLTYATQIEIPEDTNVSRVVIGAYDHKIDWMDIFDKQLTVRSKNTNIDINMRSKMKSVPNSLYQELQRKYHDNYKVWYHSSADSALRQNIILNETGENRPLQPGYFTAKLTSDYRDGEPETKSNPTEYIIGGPTMLYKAVRHNYEFVGWYASEYCTSDTLCENNELSNLRFVSTGNPLTVYAKWRFHVELTENGISYVIGEDKMAKVTSGSASGDLVIPEQISYEGVTYPVTGIAEGAFKDQKLQTVRIPKSIQTIGTDAFAGTGLTDVYMDSDTVSLGDAFPKTVNLTAATWSKAYKDYEEDGYTGTKRYLSSKITYELDGGKTENPDEYEWKSTLVLKDAVKEGCRFDGWYTDSNFSKDSKIKKIREESGKDMILYAKFTPIRSTALSAGDLDVTGEYQETDISAVTIADVKSVKLANVKGRKLRIRITGNNAAGYEIQYAVKRSMNKAKTVKVKAASGTTSKTIKHLKKGKTYYVKVRGYSYDTKGNVVYGRWYQIRKIKIKK